MKKVFVIERFPCIISFRFTHAQCEWEAGLEGPVGDPLSCLMQIYIHGDGARPTSCSVNLLLNWPVSFINIHVLFIFFNRWLLNNITLIYYVVNDRMTGVMYYYLVNNLGTIRKIYFCKL